VTAAAATTVPGTRLPTLVFDNVRPIARHVAAILASVIRERNALGQQAVLGLPTGSTPVGVYRELIRMHREEELDFSRVITFNLDEYYGLQPDRLQSYHRWMRTHLFDHINIPQQNIHIPDGTVPLEQVEAFCRDYEAAIVAAGGIDVMLLGIGRNGHIGFNEPFSIRNSRTRLCTLDPVTRTVAASDFFGLDNVPTQAITMGLATILDSRKILLLALGEAKAAIIRETVEGPVSDRVPASFLQEHSDATVLIDSAAAQQLTGTATPWLLGTVEWSDRMVKRAVLWLAQRTGKALLKLDDEDFRQHNLHHLLRHHGPASRLANRVFRLLLDTIEYHPAGVTEALRDADARRGQPKRIICFSPHPDDDVISMGGTLIRLNEDGHETHVAYMTSGNIAVFDHDALRIADLVTEYNRLFGIDEEKSRHVEQNVAGSLRNKQPGQLDIVAVQKIKGLIRWSEAKAAALVVGCQEEHLHFLDLPFYRTGAVAKNPVGEQDVLLIRQLIEQIQPAIIYVAGDLSDPHGTHRLCAEAIFQALAALEAETGARPDVLLYRGAWQEYRLDEIEIAVPLSPEDLERKRKAIFMHESQKDEALFPGSDPREFWQRAEDRNKGTADRYNQLGLPEFFALEAFVRWDGSPI
jgi:glucosamine-6-phosphate deaminase